MNAHLANLLLGLTKRQRLGLSEEVGEQDTVVKRFVDGILRRRRGDEVCGDEFRSLMNELIEGVLAVGTSRSPDDWLQ